MENESTRIMPDIQTQRFNFQNNLLFTARRLNMANLARLLSFAEDLHKQQLGKREMRNESMAARTKGDV